ncbi:FAD binding domain-containing protein [Sarocladium implicatum]|nr:FAD binding domain-containing protein [Sarocladium implicatum]
MKVLIAGGGCAGPSLAYWLVRLGHQVTVVERYPALRASGAQIDLRAQGIKAVDRMGLMPAVREKLVDEVGVASIDGNGKPWATIMANTSGHGAQGPTSEFEIMRGDLVRLLYDATKDDVEYVFGKTVESFEQDDEEVQVHFSDGTSGVYDLLVGADGQGSRIRKAMFPEATDPYIHTGLHAAYWFVPRIASDTNIRDNFTTDKGRMIMRRSHNPEETQVYFILRDHDPNVRSIYRAPEAEQKKFWKERFRGAGWQTDRFLEGMDTTKNWYTSEVVQVKIDKWHKGRVVLLGDAGYCPSPMSAMGTTNSFVGAYVLAGELSRTPNDVQTALENYDKTLRPFVEETQRVNFKVVRIFMPETSWGCAGIRWFMWAMCSLKLPQLITRFSSDEKGGWSLPDYPTLVSQK